MGKKKKVSTSKGLMKFSAIEKVENCCWNLVHNINISLTIWKLLVTSRSEWSHIVCDVKQKIKRSSHLQKGLEHKVRTYLYWSSLSTSNSTGFLAHSSHKCTCCISWWKCFAWHIRCSRMLGSSRKWDFFSAARRVCNDPQVDRSSQQLRVTLKLPVGSTKWQHEVTTLYTSEPQHPVTWCQ